MSSFSSPSAGAKPTPDGISCARDVESIEARQSDLLGDVTSTYDLLMRGSQVMPGAPALSFFLRTQDFRRPRIWTHNEWFQRITQAANLFRSLGIQRDEVIAFILPNLPETHWTIWGGEAAGIVFAINPLLEPALMAELMNAARPRILVTLGPTPGSDIWQKAQEAATQVPSLKQVLTVSALAHLPGLSGKLLARISQFKRPKRTGRLPVSDFVAQLSRMPADGLSFAAPKIDDVASYFCTGGTTGLPKIAVRTHRTEVANALELGAAFGSSLQGSGKSVFCGLPLFHVNAQIGTGLVPWASGSHVVLGTPQGYRADGLLDSFWDIAELYRFALFSGVPTVYSALLQRPPKNQDLSSLRYGICGAAPMPVELFNRFRQVTGIKILEGYGLTEAGCVSSLNPPRGATKVGSIGVRLPWQDMQTMILDDQGSYVRDAAVDEIGIIAVSGPNLFKGYLSNEHNKGLWIQRPEEDEQLRSWLNTGDLGRMDEEGFFWLTGRKKELIIRGGHNIDPKLIEETMHAHPAVAMAAAVGRPDAHSGEVPVVYVQVRPDAVISAEELLQYARQNVAEKAAWPKEVVLLPELPVTAVGKIFKPALTALQMESVVNAEAAELGITLIRCEAVGHPEHGLVLLWSARGEAASLRARLQCYIFKTDELHVAN